MTDNATTATQHASALSSRLRLPRATPNKAREDIEETASDDERFEGLDNYGSTIVMPTQPTLKRRRPNSLETVLISSESSSPSPPPTTPPYPTIEEEDDPESVPYNDSNPHARPRFVFPAPKSTGTPTVLSRPPVILPPRSPSPTTAIPAFFSPNRRGQKYIPGGLASTVRDWIVETSQHAHDRARGRRGEGEAWDTRFRVADYQMKSQNENMILVQARSEVQRWMFVGMGRGDRKVEVGCIVGIREPTWEVLIGNERYKVAIEWKIIDS